MPEQTEFVFKRIPLLFNRLRKVYAYMSSQSGAGKAALFACIAVLAAACVWYALASGEVTAAYASGSSSEVPETYTNSIGMQFVLIRPGTFSMGSNNTKAGALYDESPAHRVTINKAFYLGKYEVTQRQWETVMGVNNSFRKRSNHPVEQVSWEEADLFIRRLNELEGTEKYRLPTEAEWEYAARAGTKTEFVTGDSPENLIHYAWVKENSHDRHQPVGSKLPNPWGLHDMQGNVEEWVQDWYDPEYYTKNEINDPKGPASGVYKSIRGGAWSGGWESFRSSRRSYDAPDKAFNVVGFRVAISVY